MTHTHTLRSVLAIPLMAGAAILWAAPTFAQSTSTVPVDTVVAAECSISATPLAFGEYDPVVGNASTALDGMATITLTCTKGAAASVGLDRGLNASGTLRRMTSASGDHLSYELHQDSMRLLAWGDDILSMLTLGAATSMAPRYLTVHGRVAGGQDVSAGAYTDSVTATVNF